MSLRPPARRTVVPATAADGLLTRARRFMVLSTVLPLLSIVLLALPAGAAEGDRRQVGQGVAVRTANGGSVRTAQDATATPTSVPTPRPAVPDTPLRDPYRPQQWYLDRLGLTAERPVPDGAGQVIAILDSGVDLTHPDLADVLLRTADGAVVGRDFVDDDDDPQDAFGHGTMVAGIAAARTGNGLGIAGTVSGEVALLPVRVLDDAGRGTTSTVAAGIDWAVDQGATVVNLSLESAGVRGVQSDPDLRRAVREAVDAGAVVVVAAGNTASDVPAATIDGGVLVVGATDRADERAGFSDRGRRDLLMAPGVEIVSTWCRGTGDDLASACDGRTHTYGVADGTSFAAPQVSGLVAMLASTGLTPHEAAARLAATAIDLGEPGPDSATGRGLVSADASLGAWPDVPVPASSPTPFAAPAPSSTVPEDASPQAVAPADPPPPSGVPTLILVAAAIVVAVGLLVHGLAGGRTGLRDTTPGGEEG